MMKTKQLPIAWPPKAQAVHSDHLAMAREFSRKFSGLAPSFDISTSGGRCVVKRLDLNEGKDAFAVSVSVVGVEPDLILPVPVCRNLVRHGHSDCFVHALGQMWRVELSRECFRVLDECGAEVGRVVLPEHVAAIQSGVATGAYFGGENNASVGKIWSAHLPRVIVEEDV